MNGQKKKQILLLVLAGVLAALLGAAAFLFVKGRMTEKNYSEAIKSAEKYLVSNNFEEAVIEYKKAISVNPKNEDAYLSLAEVYVEQEQPSKARVVLREGMKQTSSIKIKRMQEELNVQYLVESVDSGEKEQALAVDLNTASENIAWNTSFMQKIAEYNYSDFKKEFGQAKSVEEDQEGYVEVTHDGLDGVCYYRNTEDNKNIVDISRNTPKETGMPEKISLNSLGAMFRNFDGGISINRLQIFFGIKLIPKSLDDKYYIETKTEDCIIRIETDAEGNIISPNVWNEIILLNANNEKSESGHLSGVVLDAVSGKGVNGAALTFKPSKKSGKATSIKAGTTGIFSVDLKPDIYTILITANDYIEEEFEFEIEEGQNYSGEQFTISPELTKGTARIVLEWNAEPQDLDSYLSGSTDNGEGVYVSFRNKQAKAGDKMLAELDLDDVNGYGPETTTIYNLNGVYEFHVADFKRTLTMREYGATVKVYLPGKEPVTIVLDQNADVKDIWNVCVIDHGKLEIINDAPEVDNFTRGSK